MHVSLPISFADCSCYVNELGKNKIKPKGRNLTENIISTIQQLCNKSRKLLAPAREHQVQISSLAVKILPRIVTHHLNQIDYVGVV